MTNSTEIAEIGKPKPRPRGDEFSVIAGREPDELIAWGAKAATALAGVVEDRKLFVHIKGRKFIRSEGWFLLAALAGFTIREVQTVQNENGDFESTAELVRLSDGMICGRGSATCGVDEPTWKSRPRYARRSMAMTRASAKCCRLSLAWLVELAGYDPGVAEEMPDSSPPSPPVVPVAKPQSSQAMTIDATATDSTSAHVNSQCNGSQIEAIRNGFRELGSKDLASEILSNYGVNKIAELSQAKAQTLLGELSTRQMEKQLSL